MKLMRETLTVDYMTLKSVIQNDAAFNKIKARRAVPMVPALQEALQRDNLYELRSSDHERYGPLESLMWKQSSKLSEMPHTERILAEQMRRRVIVKGEVRRSVFWLYVTVENPNDAWCDLSVTYRVFPLYGVMLETDRVPTSGKRF